MKPNLKLVNNMDTAELLVHPSSIQALIPKANVPLAKSSKQKSSYALLILIIAAHLAGLIWLVNAKQTPPAIKEALPPMMVSLVANPAPEPEVVPLVPAPPQPVIKKQKPIVKKKAPAPEPVAKEPEMAPPVMTEAAPTVATPMPVAKAPEVVEAPQPVVEQEAVIEPPRFGAAYLHNPAPDYPPMSRRMGEQGRVLLRVLVSTSGTAENVQVENGSGSNRLDQAAMQAVRKWTFIPAKQSNKAVSAYVLVPVKFSLES